MSYSIIKVAGKDLVDFSINIPTLKIEYDYGIGDIGQIKTRIEAFIEMISN